MNKNNHRKKIKNPQKKQPSKPDSNKNEKEKREPDNDQIKKIDEDPGSQITGSNRMYYYSNDLLKIHSYFSRDFFQYLYFLL